MLSTLRIPLLIAVTAICSFTFAASSALADVWEIPRTFGTSAIASYPHGDSPGVVGMKDGQILLLPFSGDKVVLAGSGEPGFKDGPANSAVFGQAQGIAVDKQGNIYVADTDSHVIRRFDNQTKVVTTIAGQPNKEGFANGPVGAALFNAPTAIAFDKNEDHLIVADTNNNCLRAVDLKTNTVSTLTGGPDHSPGYADGQASEAKFNHPRGIAIHPETGLIFVSDTDNHVLRSLDPATGRVKTEAGVSGMPDSDKKPLEDGEVQLAKFNLPHGLAIDSNGDVLIADKGRNMVKRFDRKNKRVVIVESEKSDQSVGPAELDSPVGVIALPTGEILTAQATWNVSLIAPQGELERDLLRIVHAPENNEALAESLKPKDPATNRNTVTSFRIKLALDQHRRNLDTSKILGSQKEAAESAPNSPKQAAQVSRRILKLNLAALATDTSTESHSDVATPSSRGWHRFSTSIEHQRPVSVIVPTLLEPTFSGEPILSGGFVNWRELNPGARDLDFVQHPSS